MVGAADGLDPRQRRLLRAIRRGEVSSLPSGNTSVWGGLYQAGLIDFSPARRLWFATPAGRAILDAASMAMQRQYFQTPRSAHDRSCSP